MFSQGVILRLPCYGYSHMALLEWNGDVFDIVVYLDAQMKQVKCYRTTPLFFNVTFCALSS